MTETPHEEPVVRDKRRVHIDPESGIAVPGPAAAGSGAPTGDAGAAPGLGAGGLGAGGLGAGGLGGLGGGSVEVSQLRTEVAERVADLQRLQAEYSNYRKRVERDRAAVRDFAVGEALSALLPVLDDIGRARDHGELEGGFKQVAESLEQTVAKLGLTAFGQPGDPFDPTLHEALMHSYSDDVTEPTAVQILQPGYSYAGRVVRPARVAVAEPTTPLAAEPELGESETAERDDEAGPSASDEQ